MNKSSDHAIEKPLEISIKTEYLPYQSEPKEDKYVFAYHIGIHNHNEIPVKLMHRHWIIQDGHGGTTEVQGEGVNGMQPTIQPGESFQYSSGAIVSSPVATMHGSYQMVALADEERPFNAPIPPFELIFPKEIH